MQRNAASLVKIKANKHRYLRFDVGLSCCHVDEILPENFMDIFWNPFYDFVVENTENHPERLCNIRDVFSPELVRRNNGFRAS